MNILRCSLLIMSACYLTLSSNAKASFIYDYSATCAADCSVIGLNDNDPIGGFIEFSETNFLPDGILGTEDVLSFSMTAGDVSINSSDSIGWFFVGILGSDSISIDIFALGTSEALDPDRGDIIAASWAPGGVASLAGACLPPISTSELCQSYTWDLEPGVGTLSGGTLIRRGGDGGIQVPVPVPPTTWLFAAALFALALVRRKSH